MGDQGRYRPINHTKNSRQNYKGTSMTCNNSKAMYDTLVRIYKKDSDQEKCLVLQEFYNYKYDSLNDAQTNISVLQNLVFKLQILKEEIKETMLISKILTILPEKF